MNYKAVGIGVLGVTAMLQVIWIIQSDSWQDSAFHILALAAISYIIKKSLAQNSKNP